MTDEELEKTIQEMTARLEEILAAPAKSRSKEERNEKVILQLKIEALQRIQLAREKGSLQQEIKAGLDYTLLTNYGKKPMLLNYIRGQSGWYGF